VLEECGCISKPKRNNPPLERSIAGAESSLLFIPLLDSKKVVCMLKVKLCIDAGLGRSFKEIRHKRKQIAVLLGNSIQTPIVNTKAEGAILLVGEEHGSTMRGRGRVDEAVL
jgi:hypothetical protein